jgi:hypothetical protein
MSTDYSASTIVGFRFSQDELREKFGKPVGAKSHMEPRFDKKTGKSIDPEEVTDHREGIQYTFLGKDLELVEAGVEPETEELCEAIAEHLGCMTDFSHYYDVVEVYFYPKMPERTEDGMDGAHFSVGGPLPFDGVMKMAPKLKKLGEGLKKLGLKPGKPGIHITYSVDY